jgi:predicted flap endonuclease-1-like 5' DNA nuclease
MKRDDEFDIDTDDAAAHAAPAPKAPLPDGVTPNAVSAATSAPATLAPATSGSAESPTDDAVIEVGDDEIETADAPAPRQTLPSPASSSVVQRSRPPAPPSVRPRSPASSQRAWLPPPRHLSSAPPSVGPVSSPSASSRPASADPWVLANRTLELSRANTRVAELLEKLAYRDARISELEQDLVRLRQRLEALEGRPASPAAREARASEWPADDAPSTGHEPEPPVVTQTRPALGAERSAIAFGESSLEREPVEDDDSDDSGYHHADDHHQRDSDFGALSRTTGSEEDLQQISGIGPRYEAALRKQGITRLSQIAAWSEADVRQVAKALKIPKSRIVKGRWVEVAREVIGTRLASE